jgi:2-polyprenyl-3-methyl-5-hydroxy-6-metoxy-1,4-benzoquinol methylase
MKHRQKCPNCPESPTNPIFVASEGGLIVQCSSCGLQFAEEYPEIESADSEIYGSEYFRASLEEQGRRMRIFGELLAEVESVIHRKGRLLDVGTGEGTLLLAAVERGWEAEGTEIASVMVHHIREKFGLTVHQGVLEDLDLPPRSFDAIIMNHVLEHVRDPRTTLEKVAELLSPGGVVRIEVPNLVSLSNRGKNFQSRHRLKKNPWKHYSTDHHFWFFTPKTLRATLETAGLFPLAIRAPAKQWGESSFLDGMTNILYGKTLWGGHLVAYAGAGRCGKRE